MPKLRDITQEIIEKLTLEGKTTFISEEESQKINERINKKMEKAKREYNTKMYNSAQKRKSIYINT